MLTLAIQKSGRLSEKSLSLLHEAGLIFENGGRTKLRTVALNFPLQILFLRDDDIPECVADKIADIGIVGENILLEKDKDLIVGERLGFAKCRLSIAVPKQAEYKSYQDLHKQKIATSYPYILRSYLKQKKIAAEIHEINGSVELAPGIGLADAIFDIVNTGSTLLSNGLKEVETVLNSEAVLIHDSELEAEKKTLLDRLLFRFRAVNKAKNYKYILLNAPDDAISSISDILPGMKSPTVIPLATKGWSLFAFCHPGGRFLGNYRKFKIGRCARNISDPYRKNDTLKGKPMQEFYFPDKNIWSQIIRRPLLRHEEIESQVQPILKTVRENGDTALREFSWKFDQIKINNFKISHAEIKTASEAIDKNLKAAIKLAAANIRKFHASQMSHLQKVETSPGVLCWQKKIAIEKIGLYIPGGTAPLFSTVLMLAIPATIAGCSDIVLCTPPDKQGNIAAPILYAADLVGIQSIFKVGGAHAIAALAYGTESIPGVYKIFGPGNQYVTAAKNLVQLEGVAVDMPAGPSEVAVLADASANPSFIAADLLSQAEHGPDSQVLLVSTAKEILEEVKQALQFQLNTLPRKEIAELALSGSKMVQVKTMEEALQLINIYAPEHLIIMTKQPEVDAEQVINAGSVFLGKYSPEAAGDYASGTNHTLPTNGCARSYSGLTLDAFTKTISFQHISEKGLNYIGKAIEHMAQAEKMEAHRRAVGIRLQEIKRRQD